MSIPSFHIPINEIPEPGRLFEATLPGEWLKACLLDAYAPAADLGVMFEIQKVQDNVLVQGTLSLTLSFLCSRTGDAGLINMTLRVFELFQPAQAKSIKLDGGLQVEDLEGKELYTFADRDLDLEPLIREQIVLAQDPYPAIVGAPNAEDDTVAWSSRAQDVDPRWQKLKDLEIN